MSEPVCESTSEQPTVQDLQREIQTLHAHIDARIDALEAKLPPENIYTLPQVATRLCVSVGYLRVLLSTHRAALSPARYRWDSRHVSHRMLTVTDLAFLHSLLLRPTTRRMTTPQREAVATAHTA